MSKQRRRCGKKQLVAATVTIVALCNLMIAISTVNREIGISVPYPGDGSTNFNVKRPTNLKLPTPIFVVGYPKVGTTSIHAMFMCSGVKSSHYCCCGSNRTHTHCNGKPDEDLRFAGCMRANKKAHRPILEGCGDYDVYAQMDAEVGTSIYLPQHFDLELLHEYSPNATFLLNLRPPGAWMNSVTHWYGLGGRFLNRFKIDIDKVHRNKVLEEIFNNHTQLIRDFVRSHPSHHLVEVDISHPMAGETLSRAFGTPASCWGLHNKNKRNTSK